MRENGVDVITATCEACGHEGDVNTVWIAQRCNRVAVAKPAIAYQSSDF
jgi:hypothetical protein